MAEARSDRFRPVLLFLDSNLHESPRPVG